MSRKPKPEQPVTAAGARKDLVALLRANSHARHMHDVWRDWVEMVAIAISNAVDLHHREEREARYLQIAGRYRPDEMMRFAHAHGALICALEEEPTDVLGETYMVLEISNSAAGQFFTPIALCRVMSGVQVDDDLKAMIAERGFVTASDPAVGAGATLIAFANELRDAGINYQQHLHVVGQDIDVTAVHMAYVQLALLDVPAIVVLGNSLAVEEREHWFTPAHVLGGWSWRLRGEVPPGQLIAAIAEAVARGAPANEPTAAEAPAVGQLALPLGAPPATAPRAQRRRVA